MLTALKLVAQFADVLVTIDTLNFVVLDETAQEEATLDEFYIFLDDDLFPEFGSEKTDIPALKIAQNQVQNWLGSRELNKDTELAEVLDFLIDACTFVEEVLAHEIKVELLKVKLFEEKLPEGDEFPALVEFDVHQIPVKDVLGEGFLHEGFKGADLTFFRVKIKLFEPAVDKLRETCVLLLAGK